MKATAIEDEVSAIRDWEWGDIATEVPDFAQAYNKACIIGAQTYLEHIATEATFSLAASDHLHIRFMPGDCAIFTDNLTDLILDTCKDWPEDDTRLMVKLLREVADKAESKITSG